MKTQGTTSSLSNLLQSCINNKAYVAGKLLHARILRTGVFSNVYFSNRLVELYSKCDQVVAARYIFDKIPERNIYSWHAMLSAYCNKNQLENANQLFDQMPERNSVSWNMIISALVQNGFEKRALETYSMMSLGGFMPSRFTLASVLRACGDLADKIYGEKCQAVAVKVGLYKNVYVGNSLLAMYAKCRCVGEALKAFWDLVEPNEVSFTALMGALVEMDRLEEAFHVFKLMLRSRIRIDTVSLSSVLGVCKRGETCELVVISEDNRGLHHLHGKQIHGLVIKLGFEKDLDLSNSLLDMYAKRGEMDSAEVVFNNLSDVSVVSWNIMIGGFGQKNEKERVFDYVERMLCCGFKPDDITYINILVACNRCGDVENGRWIFDRMVCPSLSSWNCMLSGYAKNGNHKEAIELFRDMQFCSVRPDRSTLAVVFSSCSALGHLEGGKQVHGVSIKSTLHMDTFVASGTIGMYSKCSKMTLAKRVFDGLPHVDVVCWNSIIAGLSFNSMDEEAFTLFIQILRMGRYCTEFSYATILSCCSKLSSLSQGRQVHAVMVKDGYATDVFVGSSLVDMYSKCGDVDGARKFFDSMPFKNTVIWNEMLHGYAQNGRGEEAFNLYGQMLLSGAKPDEITFIAVLTACSHSGLVDVGIQIFNSMKDEHGVEPLLDHYTCLIDSLGRAGRFNDLEALIEKTPYKNDPIVWEVLLSSCRVHNNVSLARRSADELFSLDPKNSAPYVLLANMYASLGRWNDANNVREMMIERQVTKDPGSSWLEHEKGTMYLYA